EVVEVALDTGVAFGRGGDVGLPAQPGDERLGDGGFTFGLGTVVAAQGGCEAGVGGGHFGQAAFQQGRDGPVECFFVALVDRAASENVFLQRVHPVVHDLAQGAGRLGGGGQSFGQAPVDGLQPVQRGLGLGNLDLGDGEVGAFG